MNKFVILFSDIKIFVVSSIFIIILLIYDTIFNKGRSVVSSWYFLFFICLLFLNILFCSIKKIIQNQKMPFYFYLIHIGVLVVIIGFVLSGIFKIEGEMFLKKDDESNIIYSVDGEMYRIPYRIKLEDFQIEYYKNPFPILVGENKEYNVVEGKTFEYKGVIYKIERFLNDFVMDEKGNFINRTEFFNNPAVMISYFKDNKKEKIWLFEGRSAHRQQLSDLKLKIKDLDIKNFTSTIRIIYKGNEKMAKVSVNMPYKFLDYKIYQTGYDPVEGKSSILTIKKDNYSIITLIGFILIGIGVVLWIL